MEKEVENNKNKSDTCMWNLIHAGDVISRLENYFKAKIKRIIPSSQYLDVAKKIDMVVIFEDPTLKPQNIQYRFFYVHPKYYANRLIMIRLHSLNVNGILVPSEFYDPGKNIDIFIMGFYNYGSQGELNVVDYSIINWKPLYGKFGITIAPEEPNKPKANNRGNYYYRTYELKNEKGEINTFIGIPVGSCIVDNTDKSLETLFPECIIYSTFVNPKGDYNGNDIICSPDHPRARYAMQNKDLVFVSNCCDNLLSTINMGNKYVCASSNVIGLIDGPEPFKTYSKFWGDDRDIKNYKYIIIQKENE